jgi:hypothetical protein
MDVEDAEPSLLVCQVGDRQGSANIADPESEGNRDNERRQLEMEELRRCTKP